MPKTHLYSLITYVFLLALTASLPAHALSVDQLRIGVHPDKTRIVLELSDPTEFRVFLLPDPYRIVIDLPEFVWRGGQVPQNSGSAIQRVRYGALEQGYGRAVFDLGKPVSINSAFLLPRNGNQPNRLVIDITGSNDARFRNELQKIHGLLKIPGANGTTPQQKMAAAPQTLDAQLQQKRNNQPAPQDDYIPPAPQKPLLNKPVVVIDAGHGGDDPGAVGAKNVYEKNVTLALARELKKQLEQDGNYKVLLTRNNDTFIRLKDRVTFAHRNNADLFISIHADSIDKPGVRGASFYTLSDKASDEQSEKLAARENKADMIAGLDLSTEDEEVANILVDLAMRDTMNQSRFFAGRLSKIFSFHGLNLLDKPQRSAGFAVLKSPDIPSVLIEAGFMSNSRESAMLNSAEHRKKLGAAIKKGIDAYFEQVRKNQRS